MNNKLPLLLIAAAALSSAAQADALLEPQSATVRYDDVDTNTAAGAALLYGRIKSAAETVCGNLASTRSLALWARYRECIHHAIGNAVSKVDRPAVTEYAIARGTVPANALTTTRLAQSRHE